MKTDGAIDDRRSRVSRAEGGGTARETWALRSTVFKPAGHRVSYKKALLRPKTFKRRTNQERTKTGEFKWTEVGDRRGKEIARRSVWGRLEPQRVCAHQRLGRRVNTIHDRLCPQPAPCNFLELLRARADGRCFNCFASDHRIAQCRDPPRCVLCSRSGHRARYCTHAPGSRGLGHSAATPTVVPPLAGRTGDNNKMEPLLDPIPGAPERRPERVTACTVWTGELRAAEHDVTTLALVAVQLDARVWLTCETVRRDVLHQLRIPEHELTVVRLKPATFLLRFLSPQLRNEALAARVSVCSLWAASACA